MRILQPEVSMLLVGLITAPAVVGLLRIANTTAQTAAAATVVLSHVAMPIMARLHVQGDRERLQKTVTGVAQAQFASVFLVSLPLLLFPGPLISLAFGQAFAPAANALRIIMAGQIANAAFGPNVWVLNMTNHERRVARAMAIALGVTVVSVPLLTLKWGIVGAATGLLASMLCWNVIAWRDAQRLLRVETSILHWPWR
jgi:O-antigen/teichoic acid export membrane protein